MSLSSAHEVTNLLKAWCAGEGAALDRLMPLVYEELHRAARHYMRLENTGNTLQTTALINEVYLRGVSGRYLAKPRPLFCGLRDAHAAHPDRPGPLEACTKRGGGAPELPFDEALFVSNSPSSDLLTLDEAMSRLAEIDQRKCRVVEMRFFGGLSVEESAEVLKVSVETVKRDWRLAKVWFLRELTSEHLDGV